MTRACPDPDVPDGAWLVLREEEGWPYESEDYGDCEDDHDADDEDWDDDLDDDFDDDDFERYEREEEAK